MVEKAYRSMKTVGAGNIALGIIMAVVGVTAGILTIIGGARLLRNKQELTLIVFSFYVPERELFWTQERKDDYVY